MKKSGEITLFLCAIAVTVSAVLLASWQLARSRALLVYAEMVTETSLESCFAEFYRPLWDEYRILAFYEKEPLEDRIDYYLETERTGNESFLTLPYSQVQVQRAVYVTEQGGYWVQESGVDYMKYHVAADVLGKLTEPFALVEQIKKAAGFIKELAGFSEQVLEAEAQLRRVKGLAERVVQNLFEAKNQVLVLAEQVEAVQTQIYVSVTEEEAIFSLESYVLDTYERLAPITSQLREDWSKLVEAVEVFQKQASGLAEKLDGVEAIFVKEEYTGAVKQVLEERLEQVKTYSSSGGSRYGAVLELKERLFSGISQIETYVTIADELSQKETFMERVAAVDSWIQSVQNTEWKIPDWLKGLGEIHENEEVVSEFDLENWSKEALVQAVIGEEATISASELKEEDLLSEEVFVEGAPEVELASSLWFRAYLTEALSHFGETKSSHALQYEVEYLLGGYLSDRENLLAVIGDLILLRECINFISYASDPVKVEEATAMAVAIAGVSAMPALVSVLQTGILAAMALEAALLDVRALMQGESVPLFHMFGEAYFPLKYAGYMQVLLGFLSVEELRVRCLDVIQATMRQTEAEFDLQKCIYEAEAEVMYSGAVFGKASIKKSYGYDS